LQTAHFQTKKVRRFSWFAHLEDGELH
jgi:hypothetical protein